MQVRRGGILYISYDGILEPLGQSQVLSYLEKLAPSFPIHLISFEKPEDWSNERLRTQITDRMRAAGISWHPLRYHKTPSSAATAYDIAQGIGLGLRLVRRHRLSIIHARSYVPSIMAMTLKRLTGARFIFDMRGFWADERVDAGIWARGGHLHVLAKKFERRFLMAADAVVSLTHAAKQEIETFSYLSGRIPPITVIPTCANLKRFSPPHTKCDGPFTLGYVGTVGNWYDFEQTARLFVHLRAEYPDARLLVVNRGEHGRVNGALSALDIPPNAVRIVAADHDDVPDLIRQMTAGILIARPSYSHIARSPTKLAEFLGCGVPCLVNSGVGDTESIISESGTGVVIREYSKRACQDAIRALVTLALEVNISDRCAGAARRHFSLADGVDAYARVYKSLSKENDLRKITGVYH